MTCRRDERAVSHVVGALLMVSITVLLASVVGVMVADFEQPGAQPPLVATSGGFHLGPDGASDNAVVVEHNGGENVDVEDVTIRITTDAGTVVRSVPTTGDLSDGVWSSAEKLSFGVQTDDICGGGDEAEIRLVHHNEEGQTATIAEETVPLEASEFTIQDGSVTPEHDYSAEVQLIGTGYPNGMTVAVTPIIGGTVRSAWSMTSHGEHSGLTQEFDDLDAGTSVAVRARGDFGIGWVYSTTHEGAEALVYRDGDTAPTFTGYDGQPDADEYVEDHMTGNEIDIADNQAIFFFEVATADQSDSTHDLQDAVVLVTFTSAEEDPEFVEEADETRVVCPA